MLSRCETPACGSLCCWNNSLHINSGHVKKKKKRSRSAQHTELLSHRVEKTPKPTAVFSSFPNEVGKVNKFRGGEEKERAAGGICVTGMWLSAGRGTFAKQLQGVSERMNNSLSVKQRGCCSIQEAATIRYTASSDITQTTGRNLSPSGASTTKTDKVIQTSHWTLLRMEKGTIVSGPPLRLEMLACRAANSCCCADNCPTCSRPCDLSQRAQEVAYSTTRHIQRLMYFGPPTEPTYRQNARSQGIKSKMNQIPAFQREQFPQRPGGILARALEEGARLLGMSWDILSDGPRSKNWKQIRDETGARVNHREQCSQRLRSRGAGKALNSNSQRNHSAVAERNSNTQEKYDTGCPEETYCPSGEVGGGDWGQHRHSGCVVPSLQDTGAATRRSNTQEDLPLVTLHCSTERFWFGYGGAGGLLRQEGFSGLSWRSWPTYCTYMSLAERAGTAAGCGQQVDAVKPKKPEYREVVFSLVTVNQPVIEGKDGTNHNLPIWGEEPHSHTIKSVLHRPDVEQEHQGPCGEETSFLPQVLLMETWCMFKDEDREQCLGRFLRKALTLLSKGSSGASLRGWRREAGGSGTSCAHICFDRPRHPGFEIFNTRKTPFLIKIVLQREENTGGTVGDPALVKRKKTVREGPERGGNLASPCCRCAGTGSCREGVWLRLISSWQRRLTDTDNLKSLDLSIALSVREAKCSEWKPDRRRREHERSCRLVRGLAGHPHKESFTFSHSGDEARTLMQQLSVIQGILIWLPEAVFLEMGSTRWREG
ncbi:hypothetical protein FQN60_015568 [Etheostoma spectabile]|uniref:Uncharacterized protein n=1 Tax=Etheostoma spectabile TaxID=54343 RepID=A0A5J5CM84_9PERO|nr:hypothetical protein FQN60_015568 [Etheostoma spectabile]